MPLRHLKHPADQETELGASLFFQSSFLDQSSLPSLFHSSWPGTLISPATGCWGLCHLHSRNTMGDWNLQKREKDRGAPRWRLKIWKVAVWARGVRNWSYWNFKGSTVSMVEWMVQTLERLKVWDFEVSILSIFGNSKVRMAQSLRVRRLQSFIVWKFGARNDWNMERLKQKTLEYESVQFERCSSVKFYVALGAWLLYVLLWSRLMLSYVCVLMSQQSPLVQ